ncbi:hypothetical protein Pcinc_037451 [Petrolisthes cinctipes]|uniref:Uncharacterized protein n=1 Tax=Petrolisthes cinctipes TaxID=88211 RepID=A0AAE1BVY6_PETCI|nr:hypothetical protein Pcinc_037451 [Petrolisthes cinctipes]
MQQMESLKKTRVVVEQTIGIWKARFKCPSKRRRNIPLLDDPEDPDDPDDPDPAPAAAGARLAAEQARRRQIIQEYFS